MSKRTRPVNPFDVKKKLPRKLWKLFRHEYGARKAKRMLATATKGISDLDAP